MSIRLSWIFGSCSSSIFFSRESFALHCDTLHFFGIFSLLNDLDGIGTDFYVADVIRNGLIDRLREDAEIFNRIVD